MTAPTATPPLGTMTIPSPKQQFVQTLQREHGTTRRVVEAFPADQAELKPHPRSNSARQLAWTFAVEERLILLALKNKLDLGSGFPKAPESWGEAVSAFLQTHAEVMEVLQAASDEDLAGTVKFFTGPGAIGDIPKMDFLWFMLSDQIHHRGQLSVYVRMAGGKVPSIYGPSADEPWM
jgi:uncharacterized damage-inducible protein DinB